MLDLSLKSKNENCLYLNGNKNLIGINNNNPQANLDINCKKGSAALKIIKSDEIYEITYILKNEGSGELELFINEQENIILDQSSLNRIKISLLGVTEEGSCYVKELVGHIKNFNNDTEILLEEKYLLREDNDYSENIQVENLVNLKILCKGKENIITKWSAKVSIFSILI